MTKTGTLPENLYLGESERTAMRMLGQPIVHYPDPEDRFVTRHKWENMEVFYVLAPHHLAVA